MPASESITLEQVLNLVGTLDDGIGENTARDRFRRFLTDSALTVGTVRDYVESCLRQSGTQYNRALQDLVNHAARLIGFEVTFGRYQGVQGQIGYDGIWRLGNLAVVVEVKTTDAYTIKTATLTGYIDHLISDKEIRDWDHALGLYLVGRPDAELTQLASAIVAERRTQQLRIATIDSILSLAELVQEGNLERDEAVTLLQPAGPFVDDIVRLLMRVSAKSPSPPEDLPEPISPSPTVQNEVQPAEGGRRYLLTPVTDDGEDPIEERIRNLLKSGWYVFGERTPGRKDLKPGDRICIYKTALGVIADLEVAGFPEKKVLLYVRDPEKYPWAFSVRKVRYFPEKPVVIDAALRASLDAFKGREPDRPWSWFVQNTRRVTPHDFELLSGGNAGST